MSPDRSNWTFQVFDSHQEAEAAQREEYARMTPAERINLTEILRAQHYGYAETGIGPRLERTFTVVERDWR